MLRSGSVFAFFILCVAAASADDQLAPPDESGMASLFNGKDLTGWDGDPRLWSVQNGVIHGETTLEAPAPGNTFLIWTGGNTRDFELRLSFRCNATNNSGIQYRSKRIPADQARNKWVVKGYQHEIRNEVDLPSVSGFIYDEGGSTGKRGRIILVGQKGTWEGSALKLSDESLISAGEFKQLFRLNDWNDVVIRAKGTHIQHFMNGRLIMDFTDSVDRALLDGVLALQLHGGKPMFAEYRNIRIKELK
jgi:hypothetical protein